ncbi:MAG TPA: TetR/AcrR family transcriptional regulator [Burkholderiales bacterium]|jgi:AcrR family transcriptional regulator
MATRPSSKRPSVRPRKAPVQKRSQVTVDAIIEAAARIFVREGYPNATTNRIAELAGVSVGSLYEYFPNKASLLAALVERQAEIMSSVMRERLAQVPGRPLQEVVTTIARAVIEAHYQNVDLNRLLIAGMPRVALWRRIEQVSFSLADQIRGALAHLIADPVRLEHASFTAETVVEGLLQRTILFAHRLPGYRLEEEMTSVLMGYLGPLARP